MHIPGLHHIAAVTVIIQLLGQRPAGRAVRDIRQLRAPVRRTERYNFLRVFVGAIFAHGGFAVHPAFTVRDKYCRAHAEMRADPFELPGEHLAVVPHGAGLCNRSVEADKRGAVAGGISLRVHVVIPIPVAFSPPCQRRIPKPRHKDKQRFFIRAGRHIARIPAADTARAVLPL